jgi:hypothetical protein
MPLKRVRSVEAGAFGQQFGKAAHNHSHHSHARACWDAATRRPCAQRYESRGQIVDIPGYLFKISVFEISDKSLRLRLIGDFHPESSEEAFELIIEQPTEIDALTNLIQDCVTKNESVSFYVNGRILEVESESGLRLDTEIISTTCVMVKFDAGELRKMVDLVYSWYLSENQQIGMYKTRIEKALSVLHDAGRRVEIKTDSSQKSETTNTLYLQQLHLINKVIQLLDS